MNSWMLTLAVHWDYSAFLLVLLFSSSLLDKPLTSTLTSIFILISAEDPASSITVNRMLMFLSLQILNGRNNAPFFSVPPEKPFFYLSNPHTLSLYRFCYHGAPEQLARMVLFHVLSTSLSSYCLFSSPYPWLPLPSLSGLSSCL